MEILQQIEAIALPIVEQQGAFIVESRVRGENRGKVLELFIETDSGVTTDQCAEVSRELSQALDAAELIRGSYQLVVSSPGTDNPLRLFRQYKRNVGRMLTVRCRAASKPPLLEGELLAIEGDAILLRMGKSDEVRTIPYSDIAEARVKLPW